MSASTSTPTRRRAWRKPENIVAIVFMVGLLLYTVVPMAWMLSTSLKSQFAALQQPPRWIPEHLTLDQYRTLLSPYNDIGRDFLRYLLNSIWVSTASTVLGVAVAVPAAYAFSRFSFPGKNALFFSVLVRNMFPLVVFLIPLFILMRNLRLVDTHLSLIITYLTFGLPLSIWLLKGFYDNIPPQLEQAARIDGATRFQAAVRIILPLALPMMAAIFLFNVIAFYNDYIIASVVLTGSENYTVGLGLRFFQSANGADWALFSAGAIAGALPLVILFYSMQRFLVGGLTAGAVKG